jgi:enoyl-CoA hydratase
MIFETIKFEVKNSIATISINRPEKLNALSYQVFHELKDVIAIIKSQAGAEIHGVLLTGAGEKSFVAGADIKAMSLMTPSEGEAFGRFAQNVTELIEALPVPVIACVNGYALGGGCELALCCDFIYATENAVFSQPEVNLGLIPGFGGCVRLMRYIEPGRAKEMIYTGRSLKAEEALRMGLVNALYSTKEMMLAAAEKTLAEVALKSALAVGVCKEVINASVGVSTQEALNKECLGFRRVFESEEKQEGVLAFLEKRAPDFKLSAYQIQLDNEKA